MNLPIPTLIDVAREVRAALHLAGGDEADSPTGRYSLMLNIAQLRALSMALGQVIGERHDEPIGPFWPETKDEVLPSARPFAASEPDAHEGNLAANIAGGRFPEPGLYLHTIVVKDAAAVPGIQSLLFLYRAIDNVTVEPAGIDKTHWQLTWTDNERDVDLDFLRPHIMPPKRDVVR